MCESLRILIGLPSTVIEDDAAAQIEGYGSNLPMMKRSRASDDIGQNFINDKIRTVGEGGRELEETETVVEMVAVSQSVSSGTSGTSGNGRAQLKSESMSEDIGYVGYATGDNEAVAKAASPQERGAFCSSMASEIVDIPNVCAYE